MAAYGDFNFKKYIYYFLIFIVISVSVFLIVYFMFSQEADFHILISFSLESIITLFTLIFIYYTLDGIRLYYILKSLNYNLSFKDMYLSVFLKYFISNVTPFSTGGGLAQIYYLQDIGVGAGKSTAAVLLRTVISTSILLFIAPLIMLSNQELFSLITGKFYALLFVLFVFIYFFILYTMIFKNRFLKKLILKFLNFIEDKGLIDFSKKKKILKYLFEHIEMFSEDSIKFIKKDKKSLFYTVLLTVLFLMVEYSFSYFLLRALGYYGVSYINIVFLHTVIAFIMYFTPTPGATGGAEAGFIIFYRQLVERHDILSLLFFWRFFTKYLGITIGIFVFTFLVLKDRREKING